MIAYIDSTGKIVGGCWADSPDHINTITRIPDGCTAVYIDDTQYPDVWNNMGEYTVQNGVPVHTPIPDDVKLANAKQAKIAELAQRRDATLAGGFQSSALGSPHTYSSDATAQANFDAKANQLQRRTDIMTVGWNTKESGFVIHTRDQFFQVYDDGVVFKESTWQKYFALRDQVKQATTIDQVNAIKW